jgi:hypothetical protein
LQQTTAGDFADDLVVDVLLVVRWECRKWHVDYGIHDQGENRYSTSVARLVRVLEFAGMVKWHPLPAVSTSTDGPPNQASKALGW